MGKRTRRHSNDQSFGVRAAMITRAAASAPTTSSPTGSRELGCRAEWMPNWDAPGYFESGFRSLEPWSR
jgi:hypothetical protein